MTTRNLLDYALINWDGFKDTISAISKRDDTETPLVESEQKLYSFDRITEYLFPRDKKPSSADGLEIETSGIKLIEFKSGFKREITKYNFDNAKGKCEFINDICPDYWNLFFKEQDKEVTELISSIHNKAIESYVTLEKKVFPNCPISDKQIKLGFIVVVDENGVDSIEDTYAELAGIDSCEENYLSDIRKSLRRLIGCHDANGNDYYYDYVDVLSATDFLNQLKLDT